MSCSRARSFRNSAIWGFPSRAVFSCLSVLLLTQSYDNTFLAFLSEFLRENQPVHCCLQGCFSHGKAHKASPHASFFPLHRPYFSFLSSSPNSFPNLSEAGGGWLLPLETASAQTPLSPLAPPAGSPCSKGSLGILGQAPSRQRPAATVLCPWPCQRHAPSWKSQDSPAGKRCLFCLSYLPSKVEVFLNCQGIAALLNLDG